MHNRKRKWLGSVLFSLLLLGCGEGNNTARNVSKANNEIVVNTEFAATYLQTIGSEVAPANHPQPLAMKIANAELHYSGQMKITNISNGKEQLIDWPVIQNVDGSVVSHRALTLKPGHYDFILILNSEEHQYVAKALGKEIIEGESPEIDFVLEPNLGNTITDINDIQYASALKFELLPNDIAGLANPQFGLSLNGGNEQVFTINKATGVTQALLYVEPGEYQLSMRLYDGNLMVGKNGEQGATINLVEGEEANMDVIPLQADVNLNLTPLKDQGIFTFTVPAEVIHEIGEAHDLALIVRLSGDNIPKQERLLTVRDENGIYKASELFETGGRGKVDAYLAFHKISEASEQFNHLPPFASCNTSIDVELNQTLGCKLELRRGSMLNGRTLSALMLSVFDQDLQPAVGVKVYVDDKLVGLTGERYSTGSIKALLEAGNYEIKAAHKQWIATDKIEAQPLSVLTKVLYFKKNLDLGEGSFEHSQTLSMPFADTRYNALADVDNDNDLDLLSSETSVGQGVVFINNGQGGFSRSSLSFGAEGGIKGMAVGDFNGDGHIDIASLANDFLRIALNDGNGNFELSSRYPEAKSYLEPGDLNNDGYLDLIVGGSHIYYNNGDGTFESEPQDIGVYNYYLASVADLNGDRINDIVLQGQGVKPLIKLGGNKRSFVDAGIRLGEYEPEQNDILRTLLTDIDKDGDMDILVHMNDDRRDIHSQLYLNNGEGGFDNSGWDLGMNASRVVAGDYNSDGLVDIINVRGFASQGDGVKVLLNRGNGLFEESSQQPLLTEASDILIGDLDSDGDLDLNLINGQGREKTHNIYLNQPTP